MGALAEGPHAASVDRIEFELDGLPIEAIHARPEGTALGAIAMVPDIHGVRPLFDDLCRRLATHGLAVCAVEPFFRIPPAQRATMEPADRMAAVKDLYDDQVLTALAEAADHLAAADGVSDACVMGFCMGGYYTLKAAATGRFERAVSFYGMVRTPDDWQGPGHEPPLDSTGDVCPTLYIVGDQDPWVPHDDIAALRAAWAERDGCKVLVYRGGDHGFVHDPDRPAHRPDDATDAWRHALAWCFEGA